MLAGFAVEGFVLSAILVHMVPLTAAVGLGTAGVFVASLFGPSQVASRFINMLFGGGCRKPGWRSSPHRCCRRSAVLLRNRRRRCRARSLFAILFGLGSGLMSIVGGTLPLELFGRDGYGAGWAGSPLPASSLRRWRLSHCPG